MKYAAKHTDRVQRLQRIVRHLGNCVVECDPNLAVEHPQVAGILRRALNTARHALASEQPRYSAGSSAKSAAAS